MSHATAGHGWPMCGPSMRFRVHGRTGQAQAPEPSREHLHGLPKARDTEQTVTDPNVLGKELEKIRSSGLGSAV